MNQLTAGILQKLRSADGFLSGEVLCREFSMTRSGVWKHIRALRDEGYRVEAVTGKGYRLTGVPDLPTGAELDPLLVTGRMGRECVFYTSIGSTNAECKERARRGAVEGFVVAADEQEVGRGRMQRRWVSPPGVNLYFSLVLRPCVPPVRIPQIPLLVAAAVHQAFGAEAPSLHAEIKWPNDILCRGRKLCGILCEMESEADMAHFVIAGVGINVNLQEIPGEIERIATSLALETGRIYSRSQLLAAVLNRFEPLYDSWLASDDLGAVRDVLERNSFLQGRRVEVERFGSRIRGRAAGISPTGELLLDLDGGGRESISSGEAHLVGGTMNEPESKE
ncbi:biotin--[acetyl-CoA-carboxylase] ligase [Prosthecochloris sp. N3]|uniref:Bifunctional ligase/repressor BirA n=1 Tax=Prosthecochloris ethylica TaxID=2743976 RepID=A0ABR9XU05_9CHLB|nr:MULTISPECIES: biotin--[acetyl-CoA-carboxylase] ligase [Prosthecochloris]MBF0587061.1 biotin--[acetyl-CoA-carboxylase] ligase [Prosthecochloris ethylica]MBF0637241.1 biotin--[acetyl-CoA-carboxylase] ligase [Prosthecochloris ethylica]NUK48214.1 biotin--[acetyl-CoA-carboxylase] ligase [Prosthecochloris ethylica]RNA66502.1 biotin--[acetyl-CoA-carboxylase] ligase [Prosthecochloris sp. ZM_2]